MEEKKLIPDLRFPEFEGKWEEKRTKEIAPLQRGFDLPTTDVIEGIYPVVYSNGVLRHHNEFKVEAPGIVTGRSGTIGKVSYIEENYWPHNTTLWVTDFKSNIPKFIYYFYLNFKLDRFNAGSTVPTLNRNDVHFVKKTIPQPKEQQKIASFLTAVDRRIHLLQKKKAKLEQYKKGVMQRLLGREIRFKKENGDDFPDWEEKRLGEVAQFSKGKGISKSDIVNNGDLECIRYGELYTEYKDTISEIKSRTRRRSDLVLSEANDVVIPSSGESKIDIAKASCVLRSGIALGGDINIIKTSLNGVFLAYYLNNARKKEIAGLAQGISVVHLYASQLKTLVVYLPKLPEQQKIASFLSSLDQKIEQVAVQIEKMQTWKKGLLQKMFV